MEFQLLKFSYPRFLTALFSLVTIALAFHIGFDLLHFSAKITKIIVLGIALIGFGILIFNPKKFASIISISINQPFNVVIDDCLEKIKLDSIEKWKYSGPSRLQVSKIKFVNAGESYTINVYNNKVYFEFLTILRTQIREHNKTHDKQIVNLDTEFYTSKLSDYIFKALFLLNLVFLVLLYFDAPAIRFGLALGCSFFLTLIYGLQQHVGKLKE